jgi:hypothetical protein
VKFYLFTIINLSVRYKLQQYRIIFLTAAFEKQNIKETLLDIRWADIGPRGVLTQGYVVMVSG